MIPLRSGRIITDNIWGFPRIREGDGGGLAWAVSSDANCANNPAPPAFAGCMRSAGKQIRPTVVALLAAMDTFTVHQGMLGLIIRTMTAFLATAPHPFMSAGPTRSAPAPDPVMLELPTFRALASASSVVWI
jgi:hypothetical protein